MVKHPKRPRDPNQLGKTIVDLATGGATEEKPAVETEAQRSGRAGGSIRAKRLSADQRQEIARKAAETRWRRGG